MTIKTLGQTVLLAVMVVGLCGVAAAQSGADTVRSISVTGQGEASGPPDRAQE